MFRRKRTISLFLTLVILFVYIAPVFANDSEAVASDGYSEGYLQGQQDAIKDVNGFGWGIAGGAGTVLFGLIGGSIIFVASAVTKPTLPSARLKEIEPHSKDYCEGYREGYIAKANNIKTGSTLGGVGLGLISLISLAIGAQ